MSRTVISFEDHLFGRVAVSLGFVTPEQLSESLRVLSGGLGGSSLSQIMLDAGLLDDEKLKAISTLQRKKRCRHVSADQQRDEEAALGDTVMAAGLVGLDELEAALLEKEQLARKHIHLHLGEVLVNRGAVAETEVRRILRGRRGEIRRCAACDVTFHVAPGASRGRLTCPQCASELENVRYLQLIEADGDLS